VGTDKTGTPQNQYLVHALHFAQLGKSWWRKVNIFIGRDAVTGPAAANIASFQMSAVP
jgi:hypothetical protein